MMDLTDLPEELRGFGDDRASAAYWRWTEAIAWIVTGETEILAIMEGWRERFTNTEFGEILEGGCRNIIIDRKSAAHVATAERDLALKIEAEKIAAFGRPDNSAPHKALPILAWAGARVWCDRTADIGGGHRQDARSWLDLRLSSADVRREFPSSHDAPPPPITDVPIRRGRPSKWDWVGADAALRNLDDMDLVVGKWSKAKLAEWLTKWFADRNEGEGPANSEIRKRVAAFITTRDEYNSAMAAK